MRGDIDSKTRQGEFSADRSDDLINGGAALFIVAIVHGRFSLFSNSLLPVVPSALTGAALALAAVGFGVFRCLLQKRRPRISPRAWCLVLAVVLLSDIPTRWPTVFHGGLGLPHLLTAGIAGALFLGCITERTGFLWLLICAAAGYLGVLEATHGRLLFSDDHPAFMYRLAQLKDNFPLIPFYNPMWNGGVEAREFFPSGALNSFFLLYPLIRVLDVTVHYNELVAALFFLIYPACVLLALRVLRLRAPLAPVISLFTSVLWFRYEFIFGTLGFLTSVALSPLLIALLVRAASAPKSLPWRTAAALLVCAGLFLFWSPAVFIAAPALAVLFVPLITFLRNRKGAFVLGALLLVSLPWMLIFIEASQVLQFLTAPQSGEAAHAAYPSLRKLFDDARYALRSAAPAVLLLVVPGLLILRRQHRLAFRAFGCTIVVLFFGGLLLSPLKPRLELERLMVVALYLSSVPVGLALAQLEKGVWQRAVGGMAVGSVLLMPAILYTFTANRTLERYAAFSPELPGLAAAIKAHNAGGRVAFSGYLHHQLDGGHVAPLPLLTGVPLYASRYQHDRWDHVDFIPPQFRKFHDAGIEQFFDLYNITAIAVHDEEWKPWFAARPVFYTEAWRGDKFVIYERRFGPKSWFLEGQGELLEQSGSFIRLRLDSPSAVIRFNWLSLLEVEGCRSISPAPVFEGLQFVQLDGCGDTVVIRATPPLKRLLGRVMRM